MEIIESAKNLPIDWDIISSKNYSMKKDFLIFMEKTNPCNQKYYIFRDNDNKIDSIFITFERKKLNIGMFSAINIRTDTTFIYVPLSIAKPGIIIGNKTIIEVKNAIKNISGLKIILNISDPSLFSESAVAKTCSNIILDINWTSFKSYKNDLRSHYRYRYSKALKKRSQLEFIELSDNNLFDEKLYNLYLQVYDNSRFQVEKLSIEYFKESDSKIFYIKNNTSKLGFIQLIHDYDTLVFAFIGFDYSQNKKYELYINLLLKIIEYAIENGFKKIDFGQTADEAKLKLGAHYQHLYAIIHDKNALTNFLLKKVIKFIEFKPLSINYNVFKNSSFNE